MTRDSEIKIYRRPSTPGNVLKTLYMEPLKMSVTELADRLDISRKNLSLVINGHASVSKELAYKLSLVFNTSIEVWLRLQMKLDIWDMEHKELDVSNVKPIDRATEVHAS